MRGCSLIVAVLICVPHASAQPTPKEPLKKEGKTDPPPLRVDDLKVSPGAVIVLIEEIKDALALAPKMIFMRPDEFIKLQERVKELERALKQDRKTVGVCKLSGRLDGDAMVLRGEFLFATELPRTPVFLGLLGAFLTDEGDLDRTLPQLEQTEDGYVVHVPKPGVHQLVLNFVVPVGLKRPGAGASAERSVELGLPGAAVTTLALDLPGGVKELRWNDIQEKRKGARWELALGKARTLALAWKEPVAAPGGGPYLTVDAQIVGKIEEAQVIWTADLHLEDLRGQAKEWLLALPAGARVEVKTAPTTAFELLRVDGKSYTHALRVMDPGTERWVVHVQAIQSRPALGSRLVVGPFQAVGAQRQQGSITLQAAPESLRGQRLVFHRFGETYQSDAPRTGQTIAAFHYWSLPPGPKGPKGLMRAPLELEWKAERARAEMALDHNLNLQGLAEGKPATLTTRVTLKNPARIDYLDVQFPPHVERHGTAALIAPALPFPGALPWLDMLRAGEVAAIKLLDVTLEGEGDGLEWIPPDREGRARIVLTRVAAPETPIVLTTRYQTAASPGVVHFHLPLPQGTIERTTLAIEAGEGIELVGDDGTHQLRPAESVKGPLPRVSFGWRVKQADHPASAVVDLQIRDRTALALVHLHYGAALRAGLAPSKPLPLLPADGIANLKVVSERRETGEILLSFDVDLLPRDGQPVEEGGVLRLCLPWPQGTTRKETKVRIWADGGTRVSLDAAQPENRTWKDRPVESVEGKDQLPQAVLFSGGSNPTLDLIVRRAERHGLPAMVADRALAQVSVDDEGNQHYRVRYMVRKFAARTLEVELPLAAAACLQHVTIDGKEVAWSASPRSWNAASIPVEPAHYVQPALLELEYRVAASRDGKRSWRSTFTPPRWHGDIQVARVRWQVSVPKSSLAIPVGGAQAEFRWGLAGVLLGPVPAMSAAELESWLTGREPSDAGGPVSLHATQAELSPLVMVHVHRPLWLVLCSSILLAIGLSMLMVTWPRPLLWFVLLLAGLGVAALLWMAPVLLAWLAYGCQPALAVLLALVIVQWLLRRSYRRQVVFLPGFTRIKSGSSPSSLVRAAAGAQREVSTVDAPAASGVVKSSNQGSP